MSSYVKIFSQNKLINPPNFLADNTHYEVMAGSYSYGVNTERSDVDMFGFAIPPKIYVFPHQVGGEIEGFGKKCERFNEYSPGKTVKFKDKEYDIKIYNIVTFFNLLYQNNPDKIDILFVPQDCILHMTQIGNMVREKRHMFLSKSCFPKYKGYAFSQLHKMKNKNPEGKRIELVKKHGFDTKFAYHLVRLLGECEMILNEGDLDLRRNREHLKAIRRGDLSESDILKWANEKELQLEKAYSASKLPQRANESQIKELLLNCLEWFTK